MRFQTQFVSFSCLLCICKCVNLPEVYEKLASTKPVKEILATPPMFNYQDYQKAYRVDPQRVRYEKQKQANNSAFSKRIQEPVMTVKAVADIISHQISNSSIAGISNNLDNSTTPTIIRLSKKSLEFDSYLVNEEDDLQIFDNQYVTSNADNKPEAVARNNARDHITALNSLLGKSPENQLFGLHQILEDDRRYKEEYYHSPNRNSQKISSIRIPSQHPSRIKIFQRQLGGSAVQQAEKNFIETKQEVLLSTASAEKEATEHHKEFIQSESFRPKIQEAKENELLQKSTSIISLTKNPEEKREYQDDPHTIIHDIRAKSAQNDKRLQQDRTNNQFPQVFPLVPPLTTTNQVYLATTKHLQRPELRNKPTFMEYKEQLKDIEENKNERTEAEINYEFGYRIRDDGNGNEFGHREHQKGDTTNGHYHVLLPDGRMQTVTYYSDSSGYHAEVSYDKVVPNE